MAEFEQKIHAEGHLIDSQILSEALDRIIREGSQFQILDFQVGRNNDQPSRIDMQVRAPSKAQLSSLLEQLNDLGFVSEDTRAARFEPAPAAGVAPADFYSTTHHETEVFHHGEWRPVARQRMDVCIAARADGVLECVKLRDLRAGDSVVTGLEGVRVLPESTPRGRTDFSFMGNEVSSERQVKLAVARVATLIRETQAAGQAVVWVPGPVVVHTGAGEDLTALVESGFVDAVLTGNALAVHDVESALFDTSLGVSLKSGRVMQLGHRHHMRAINTVRRAGSLAAAVEQGIIQSGIFHALVRRGTPFVLAGSIRDDGPLPDTMMDLVAAQEAYAAVLADAGLVIVLSSMLHGIGVGNMLPGRVPLVCVDIHPAVATKLSDRGTAQSYAVVTDVGLFLHLLRTTLISGAEGA